MVHLARCLTDESTKYALAEETGQEKTAVCGPALQQSALLEPSPEYLDQEEFFEPRRGGEILDDHVPGPQ